MSKKLTEWFPASVKPVHVGVYEVNDGFGLGIYAFWDGKKFGFRTRSADRACLSKYLSTSLGKIAPWRGLAVKP